MEFAISADYEPYIVEYLLTIKNENGDKYDRLKHKKSIFL